MRQVLAVFFFKGTSFRAGRPENGVSTYLALTFGTLLSSQGTDASFKAVTGPSGLSLFSSLADPLSVSAARWTGPPSRFRFPALPTLPDSLWST